MTEPPQPPTQNEKRVIVETPPDSDWDDSAAQDEARAFAAGDLRRYDRIQEHLHKATVLGVYGFFAALFVMSAVWLYHLITPASWAFLTEAQQNKLDNTLLTALGSSLVAERFRRRAK